MRKKIKIASNVVSGVVAFTIPARTDVTYVWASANRMPGKTLSKIVEEQDFWAEENLGTLHYDSILGL